MVDPTSDGGEENRAQRFDRANLPEIGDIVGLHYKLDKLLGEGNFGKVYLAERIDVPEHHVALKILPRSLYMGRNVERELVMLATVGHPHMVQMKDHGMTESYVWLTMPVYEGETLEQRLERGTLSLREAYDIFLPIARAVEALHQAGLRHQDIKPDNIFLARFAGRLHPVLLDLGVAAEKDASFIAGTALFAAPEQLLGIIGVVGAIPLTEKMDTYCFAATLLFALIGEQRFPGAKARTRDEIVESHSERSSDPLHGSLIDLQGAPRDLLERNLKKWMALDPADRPTITEVAEGLDVLLEPERELEREAQRARNGQRRSLARTRVGAAVFFVAALGLAGFGLWKRETLRLAGELERARTEGARSFDKLDSCTASFSVERKEHETCESDREKDRVEHEATITALAKTNDGCSAITTQLQTVESRLSKDVKTCREDFRAERLTSEVETKRLTSDLAAEKSARSQERTDLAAQIGARDEEAQKLKSEKEACDRARQSCVTELEACAKSTAPRPSPIPVTSSTGTPNDPPPIGSPTSPTPVVTEHPIEPPPVTPPAPPTPQSTPLPPASPQSTPAPPATASMIPTTGS